MKDLWLVEQCGHTKIYICTHMHTHTLRLVHVYVQYIFVFLQTIMIYRESLRTKL